METNQFCLQQELQKNSIDTQQPTGKTPSKETETKNININKNKPSFDTVN